MNVESSSGGSFSSVTEFMKDYYDATKHGFTSSLGNVNLGSYKNYAALANASVNIGSSISNAGNRYFGLGDSDWALAIIDLRNMYNSNGAIGSVARATGQSSVFNKIGSSVYAPGSGDNVPTAANGGGGSGSGGSSMPLVGNALGAFVGTYNFGPGVGTYNFGIKSWK